MGIGDFSTSFSLGCCEVKMSEKGLEALKENDNINLRKLVSFLMLWLKGDAFKL